VRIALLIVALLAPAAYAKNGAYKLTKHAGSCLQCHKGLHASHGGQPAYDFGLFAPNDNDLCFTCHAAPSFAVIYPGSAFWQQSIHARSINGGNKCIDCHEPHGVKDADGLVGAMLRRRDSDLCNTCHDGSRADDIAREFTKPYRHPIGTRTRHVPGESLPSAFAATPVNNRHAECSDCHNAHSIDANPALPSPPQASNRLAGVSRVEVANGGAGLAPTYVWRGPGEPGVKEYEICFKCHSSYTTQIPGQSNLALLTNPANASYHPIQAAGKTPLINSNAFAGNYDATSIIFCSDCHASDTTTIKGPHGSSYRYLLKKPSTSVVGATAMQSNDICFDCHSFEVYADNKAPNAVQRYSRFGGTRGHGYHVGSRSITCYTCHETHGSALRPSLIALRPGGFSAYTQTATGGTCTPSCHGNRTYAVSYPRNATQ
jgi:predicted CXXCH cytochrome family protein